MNNQNRNKTNQKSPSLYLALLFFSIIFLYSPLGRGRGGLANASTTDGTIISPDKYAWSSEAGWLNFAPPSGNIHITDGALTGYVWSDLYGWINLNPTFGGVHNTADGVLSGHAWGEKLGWINFTGVTINSVGLFVGQATGTAIGTINFNCTHCSVRTDWRPTASRPSGGDTGGSSGGTAFPPGYGLPTTPTTYNLQPTTTTTEPTSTEPTTDNLQPTTILPKIKPPPVVKPPSLIDTIIKKLGTIINELDKKYPDILSPGIPLAKFFDSLNLLIPDLFGDQSPLPKSPITSLIATLTSPSIPIAKFFDNLNLLLPGLFGNQPPLPKTSIQTLIARLTPPSMSGRWSYLDRKKINAFVFAPLPKEFLALEKNFPAIRQLLTKVGVEKFRDLSKLNSISLHLPGLSESAQSGSTQTPTNIIFASVANRLVDFRIALSLSRKGQPEQKITTVSGKALHLTIHPDHPVKMVTGYLVFRSRTPQIRAEIDFRHMLSAIFAEPVFAYPLDQPIPTEEKLVLQKFEYTDPDGDGIYTADIVSPISAGEYEIITVMDYEDPDLGSKQVRLITVVDPEGYVYENIGNNELRLQNVTVALYLLNQTTNKYEPWPGKDFGQENPQVTDIRGTYSFLVPVGTYYLTANTKGYSNYQSEPFVVQEGSGVHMNIELRSRYGWLRYFDWKTTLLIIVTILLIINFIKDKKRKEKNV